MTEIKDQLARATFTKKNDVNTFVWRFPKVREGSRYVQNEIKMMDATEEQLNSFYKHCITMLYNKDSKNIGRKPLLDLIREQIVKCNAMLYINWLAVGSVDRKPYPRFEFFQDMKRDLENREATLPRSVWSTAKITKLYDVPAEFAGLTIQNVFDACLDALGTFDRKHITSKFILNMGLWFTSEELKDLTERNEDGTLIDRLTVVKRRCDIKDPSIKLFINQQGLSFREFRAMRNLKNNRRYSELTTDQLTTLRDKVLNRLSLQVTEHIEQWQTLIRQIKAVAKVKGYTINEVEID